MTSLTAHSTFWENSELAVCYRRHSLKTHQRYRLSPPNHTLLSFQTCKQDALKHLRGLQSINQKSKPKSCRFLFQQSLIVCLGNENTLVGLESRSNTFTIFLYNIYKLKSLKSKGEATLEQRLTNVIVSK